MTRKVRNYKTCENLVCVATTIGQLQHSEYLKPVFLDTFKWAIRPVFPETVTNYLPPLTLFNKLNSIYPVVALILARMNDCPVLNISMLWIGNGSY